MLEPRVYYFGTPRFRCYVQRQDCDYSSPRVYVSLRMFWVLLGEEIDELEICSGEALFVELALGKFGGAPGWRHQTKVRRRLLRNIALGMFG